MNMDNEEVTFLVMFDISATFVTINHSILIDILKNDFSSVAYIYLANRRQRVVIERCKSSEFIVVMVLFYINLLWGSDLLKIIFKHPPCHNEPALVTC